MRNRAEIPMRLPSLNDYIDACRSHWSNGARFKQQVEEGILWDIKAAQGRGMLRPASGPVHVSFEWHESDKRRDFDNIVSAKKFILDAMQKAGIIPAAPPNSSIRETFRIKPVILTMVRSAPRIICLPAAWRTLKVWKNSSCVLSLPIIN